jgi:hypothetical protein
MDASVPDQLDCAGGRGYSSFMPYQFSEWEREPVPQAAFARGGIPPRKVTGVGVLDPPVPPRRPLEPLAALPASFLLRLLAALILAGIAIFALFAVFAR